MAEKLDGMDRLPGAPGKMENSGALHQRNLAISGNPPGARSGLEYQDSLAGETLRQSPDVAGQKMPGAPLPPRHSGEEVHDSSALGAGGRDSGSYAHGVKGETKK